MLVFPFLHTHKQRKTASKRHLLGPRGSKNFAPWVSCDAVMVPFFCSYARQESNVKMQVLDPRLVLLGL